MTLTAAEFMGAGPAPLNGSSAWASLPLPSGHIALIDAADLPLVSQFKWHALKARHTVYVQTKGAPANGRVRTYLHRLLMGAEPGQQVGHRNRNGLDNRRCNLRLCTPGQNSANQQPQLNGSSGYRGVSRHDNNGTNPWRRGCASKARCTTSGTLPTPGKPLRRTTLPPAICGASSHC